jgi:hypothetical protein
MGNPPFAIHFDQSTNFRHEQGENFPDDPIPIAFYLPNFRNTKTIFAVVDCFPASIEKEVPYAIVEAIERHFHTTEARISGLRARTLHTVDKSARPLLLVEWREGSDTDVMSLFYVPDLDSPSANLTIYRENIRQAGRRRFETLYLDWKVNAVEDFKELLPAAQWVLGFPEWRSDMPTGQTVEECQ